jgi:hypothetical protein
MNPRTRLVLSVALAGIFAARPSLAFEYPLSPEAIREAYFLGKQSSERRQAFLEQYKHSLPLPETGPQVGLIEVETPFVFIAEKVSAAGTNYHAQEAEQEFLGKPGHFRVHLEIYFTATYPGANDTAESLGKFWQDFTVHLKQKAEIPPLKVSGEPIYSDQTISGYMGARIDVDYNVKKIDPGTLTTIEVDTPDGQQVETTFDLSQLK